MKTYKLVNGRLVLKESILENHHLIVEEGIITAIIPEKQNYAPMDSIDAKGNFVVPAFVELHIHGCAQYGFDQLDTLDLEKVVQFLKENGINTFTPTFQCNREVIKEVTRMIAASPILQKSIPGIYIEGPFINMEKKGGIGAEFIYKPDLTLLKQIIDENHGLLKLMTLAPELDGNGEVYSFLIKNGIIPCFGHSNAMIKDVYPLNGNRVNITHLFNAMSPVTHKESGLAMLPFLNRELFFELNGDGIHVSDDAQQLCYNVLNHDKLILISDAIVSAGLHYGEYQSYGRNIISNERGVRYKKDDVLMGSNLLMNSIFKRFMKLTSATMDEGVKFASYNACKLLGIDDRRGSIEVGKEADLLLLDDEFTIK